jgi:hypothetical protein
MSSRRCWQPRLLGPLQRSVTTMMAVAVSSASIRVAKEQSDALLYRSHSPYARIVTREMGFMLRNLSHRRQAVVPMGRLRRECCGFVKGSFSAGRAPSVSGGVRHPCRISGHLCPEIGLSASTIAHIALQYRFPNARPPISRYLPDNTTLF